MLPDISEFDSILLQKKLPSHDDLFELAEAMSTLLEEEKTEYRPQAANGNPGSLIDLRGKNLPSVIIPDLHARPEFLNQILHYKLPPSFTSEGSLSVFEALTKKLINLIFLGDALHSEKTTRLRWLKIEEEFNCGLYTGPEMQVEMGEGLSLLCGLYKLKLLFPENFHFLKGNHENITNRNGKGDYGFKKYADEGLMVMNFVREFYGDDILYMINCVEEALPLMAVNQKFIVSHAEPELPYTYDQIVNARSDENVILGLTWTDNDQAEENSCSETMLNIIGKDSSDAVYFGGHRPVKGIYNLRQNGKFIQIHNPELKNVAVVYNDRAFNPETDIVSVNCQA